MSRLNIANDTHVGSLVPDDVAYPMAIKRLSKGMTVTEKGCWHSTKFVKPEGYVQMFFRGQMIYQHRLSYLAHRGPIPDGMKVLHTCDNRRCWNPNHLFLGTISDNKQDELQKGRNYESNRTHCPSGHSYAEHGVRHGKAQWRKCKLCTRARERRRLGWPESDLFLDQRASGRR